MEENWKRIEFEKGYKDGYNKKGFRPSSQQYIDGYKTGKWTIKYKEQNSNV